jgi:hypothetical protein
MLTCLGTVYFYKSASREMACLHALRVITIHEESVCNEKQYGGIWVVHARTQAGLEGCTVGSSRKITQSSHSIIAIGAWWDTGVLT